MKPFDPYPTKIVETPIGKLHVTLESDTFVRVESRSYGTDTLLPAVVNGVPYYVSISLDTTATDGHRAWYNDSRRADKGTWSSEKMTASAVAKTRELLEPFLLDFHHEHPEMARQARLQQAVNDVHSLDNRIKNIQEDLADLLVERATAQRIIEAG